MHSECIPSEAASVPVACDRERVQPYIDPNEVLGAAILLFSGVPGLLEKLCDRARRDVIDNKPHTFFDDLFVGSSHPAVGANYNVVGYRLRNVHKLRFVDGTTKGYFSDFDGHSCYPEPEITTEMVEAGLRAADLISFQFGYTPPVPLVSRVFRAMWTASRNRLVKTEHT